MFKNSVIENKKKQDFLKKQRLNVIDLRNKFLAEWASSILELNDKEKLTYIKKVTNANFQREENKLVAKKIEDATGKVTRVASTVVGQTITAGDASGPRSSINKINSTIQNSFKDGKYTQCLFNISLLIFIFNDLCRNFHSDVFFV